ncbi:MAG: TolC family protein, partial [Bacteroidia bacterium]|nr:TolC family protein [Bacteroidia bacterium]
MERRDFSITLLFFCLVYVFTTVAQTKTTAHGLWDLQQCIDYALKTNLQLKQTQLNADLGKVNLTQSEAAVLPAVNSFVSHTYNYGRTIDQYTNTFANSTVLSQNMYISGSLSLFSGLQKYNTIKQNQYTYIANKFDVDKSRNDIALNVANAYLQILLNRELLTIAQNQVAITKNQVERTQKLYDAGAVAKGNLLDLQAQQATDELSAATAQNQVDLAYLALVQYMNLDSVSGFEIQKPELTIPAENILINSPLQIYEQAAKQLPEIKSAEMKLQSARRGIAVAKGGISPQLTLNAT